MSERDLRPERHTGLVALVTGATGAVGPSLVNGLLHQGYRVRVLARSPRAVTVFTAPVEVIPGTLDDGAALRNALSGVRCVFHLAALLHLHDPDAELRALYQRVNVEGTRRLVEMARSAGVERLVFFSTINVYGPSVLGGAWDEDSPLNPDSWYAETKAEAEQIVLGEPGGVVLRLAAVYGPRMKGNYVRLARAIRAGYYVPIGAGRNRRTVVHDADVARAAVAVAAHPAAAGRVYNVTDGHVHELRDIVAAIALASGRARPRLHVPVTPVRFAAGFMEDVARLVGRRPPVSRATVQKLLEDVAVRGERIQAELGVRPAVGLLVGWRETLSAPGAAT